MKRSKRSLGGSRAVGESDVKSARIETRQMCSDPVFGANASHAGHGHHEANGVVAGIQSNSEEQGCVNGTAAEAMDKEILDDNDLTGLITLAPVSTWAADSSDDEAEEGELESSGEERVQVGGDTEEAKLGGNAEQGKVGVSVEQVEVGGSAEQVKVQVGGNAEQMKVRGNAEKVKVKIGGNAEQVKVKIGGNAEQGKSVDSAVGFNSNNNNAVNNVNGGFGEGESLEASKRQMSYGIKGPEAEKKIREAESNAVNTVLRQLLHAKQLKINELLKENMKLNSQVVSVIKENNTSVELLRKNSEMLSAVTKMANSLEKQVEECKELLARKETQIRELTLHANQIKTALNQIQRESTSVGIPKSTLHVPTTAGVGAVSQTKANFAYSIPPQQFVQGGARVMQAHTMGNVRSLTASSLVRPVIPGTTRLPYPNPTTVNEKKDTADTAKLVSQNVHPSFPVYQFPYRCTSQQEQPQVMVGREMLKEGIKPAVKETLRVESSRTHGVTPDSTSQMVTHNVERKTTEHQTKDSLDKGNLRERYNPEKDGSSFVKNVNITDKKTILTKLRGLETWKHDVDEIVSVADGWRCPQCGLVCRSKFGVACHARDKHVLTQKFRCKHCPKVFLWNSSKDIHEKDCKRQKK